MPANTPWAFAEVEVPGSYRALARTDAAQAATASMSRPRTSTVPTVAPGILPRGAEDGASISGGKTLPRRRWLKRRKTSPSLLELVILFACSYDPLKAGNGTGRVKKGSVVLDVRLAIAV